jgi:nucleotide-binding universal stress UspA family protein
MDRILIAAKAGRDEPWVADAAADLSRQTGASVAVVSVDGVEMEALSSLPRDVLAHTARETAEALALRLKAAGIEATANVRAGRVVEGILAFADECDADLLVVGASRRGRVAARLLGDVPLELVQSSKRPVLVISPPS